MRVHAHIPIGEIAASLPHVTKLLDALGVDYVMHGNLSLRDACAEAGVDPALVRRAIDELPRKEADRPAWADASMQDLLDELRDRRHPKLLMMLAETAELLAQAPPGTEGLAAVRDAFRALFDDVQTHMKKEEQTLFPIIQHLEDCWSRSAEPSMNFVSGADKPMTALVTDHAEIVEKLQDLVTATSELCDDDGMLTPLLDQIATFEHEMREHIHLENNVLYPRAVALEAAVAV
jgi:regulator of cell morphogenesis and NO signaling